jgi:octaprenyl-diphosphate synthase
MHMATLVHDDVIDASPMRRGRPTVLRTHGAGRAVGVGDALLALAFREAAHLALPGAVEALAQATLDLTRGELLQQAGRLDLSLTEETYVERCRLKTGALLAVACRLGAAVAGAPPAVQDRLARFGRDLGLAFQIVDDVMDLTAPAGATGKARGDDLAGGTVTLPVILAVRMDPGLAPAVRRAADDPEERDRLCDHLAAHPGVEMAARMASEMAAAAIDDLHRGAGGADVAALGEIATAVVGRLDGHVAPAAAA